jgi:hypothetical protein
MYKVTLRQVHAPSVAKEKKKTYILRAYICSLRFPACSAHASCRHLWSVRFYDIFPHFLINGTIFEKKYVYFDFLRHFSSKEELSGVS